MAKVEYISMEAIWRFKETEAAVSWFTVGSQKVKRLVIIIGIENSDIL